MTQKVEFKGPFFRTDAGREVRNAIGKAVSAVAAEGKRDTQALLTEGHGKDSGEFRKGIRRKKKGFTATVFAKNAMIAAWLQGTSKRNQTTSYKGINLFTDAAQATDGKAQAIADKIINALARELS